MVFARLRQLRQNARLKAWYERNERILVSSFLITGFFLHYFTFRTLEVGITFFGLGVYAALAAACILYINAFDARHDAWRHPFLQRLRLASPLLLQLAFGSLLSMALLFYWFSGALSASWPIFIALTVLIIVNERFRHAYLRPMVQVTVFSFVLFSYFTLLFPHLFNSLDASTFLFGGSFGLVLSLLLVIALRRVAPSLRSRSVLMATMVCAVFLAMNVLYFLDLIPPIPLSLREAGIFHSVKRVGNDYEVLGERETFWDSLIPGMTLHQDEVGRVYAYTAVYSPTDLNVVIYHRWEYYDTAQKRWVTTNRLSFTVTGGRVDGYRGYTYKNHPALGRWRVTVETERGQVLGRLPFTYVAADERGTIAP